MEWYSSNLRNERAQTTEKCDKSCYWLGFGHKSYSLFVYNPFLHLCWVLPLLNARMFRVCGCQPNFISQTSLALLGNCYILNKRKTTTDKTGFYYSKLVVKKCCFRCIWDEKPTYTLKKLLKKSQENYHRSKVPFSLRNCNENKHIHYMIYVFAIYHPAGFRTNVLIYKNIFLGMTLKGRITMYCLIIHLMATKYNTIYNSSFP